MAFLGDGFNVDELPESTGLFEPIPDGWYTATITEAELKNTKAGNGQYINLKYSITGPKYEGRTVYEIVNIRNASAKAEEIGRATLGKIMRAGGLTRVTDTDQLIGIHLKIELAIEPERDDPITGKRYAASNKVRNYHAIGNGSEGPKVSVAPNAAAAPFSKAPWAK
jgi:hypothetical protein